MCTADIDAEYCKSLGKLNKKLKKFVISTKKQASITSFFLLFNFCHLSLKSFLTNDQLMAALVLSKND